MSGGNEEEDDGNPKRKKSIATTTVRPLKLHSRKKDEDYKDEEGEGPHSEKEDEGCDNEHKDDVLHNFKNKSKMYQ